VKACGYFQSERPEEEEKPAKHGKGKKEAVHATNGEPKHEEPVAKAEPLKKPEPVAKEPVPEPVQAQPQVIEHFQFIFWWPNIGINESSLNGFSYLQEKHMPITCT
jgi:hypothetical protein